jgi:FtsH-binding integral membrane protein
LACIERRIRLENPMTSADRDRYLPLALRAVGLISVFGIYPLTVLWPSGWAWHASGRSEYLEMIVAIYATLGVFLWLAAANPGAHRSLISFAIWSSIVHGLVMAVQALLDPRHIHHLFGDVLALFVVAGVLGYLCPQAIRPAGGNPA